VSKLFARKSSIVALTVPLGLAVLFFVFPSLFRTARTVSVKVVTFPLVVLNSTGKYITSKKDLSSENSALKAKISELSLELDRSKDLVSENKRLKDLLAFKGGMGYETVSAEVIARDPNSWIGSFTINKGSSGGVRRGAAVCSSKGLVGKVSDVDTDTSLVMLVTHLGFRVGGILKESRLHGVVEGDGRGYATMLYLPLDSDIKPGEIVVTSGYSRKFPKGITIGKVISVEKSKTGLFKNALLLPEANAYDQEEVLCLK